jgi:DNA-binding transcriptional LysR family regulator
MKLDQLAQFVEAAKHEHLGKAARVVHVSPGAISHSIAALEEEFGKKLFAKRGKRIFLTDHGKLLAEKAQKLLADASNIREILSSDKLELRGHFRLAGTNVIAAKHLVPAWARVQKDHAGLTGEVFTRRSSEVISGVIAGEFDLGLCFSPQANIGLTSKSLHSGQMYIAVRKGHPLAGSKASEWLKKIPSFSPTLPRAFQGVDVCEIHPMFEKYEILFKKAGCLIDSYEIAIEMVANSNSWSLIPEEMIRRDKRLKVLDAPSGWKAPYEVSAIWPAQSVLPRALVQLVERVRESFER